MERRGAHVEPGSDRSGTDENGARELDRQQPAEFRDRFLIPTRDDGQPVVYFCGNSLGLQPKTARAYLEQELADWERFAVHAHFDAATPWYSYHEVFRDSGARLVGAEPGEVVMMNSLTVNLHLMMASFYHPTSDRWKILMEETAFPSDTYAVRSQLSQHGRDPDAGVVLVKPPPGESTVRTEDVEALLAEQGQEIALVLLGGVNYFTGQAFDMERIAEAAHRAGCRVGYDLAHAAGNLDLRLHDWDVDFAVWCSYKYLNGGPGAVGGCFVHERHGNDPAVPRLAGWWGNDPAKRFDLPERFEPSPGADGWQLSNPPILAMAALKASLEIFDEVGMARLRTRSLRLTGYLETLLEASGGDRFEVITPRSPGERGCQLSIRVRDDLEGVQAELERKGIVCDIRPPDVIRAAPVPLYNTFHDIWTFVQVLTGAKA